MSFRTFDINEVQEIDRYLSGVMADAERAAFEVRLEQDERLCREVELQRLTIAALRHHGQQQDEQLGRALGQMSREQLVELLQQCREGAYNAVACNPAASAAQPAEQPAAHDRNVGLWIVMLVVAAIVVAVGWCAARLLGLC